MKTIDLEALDGLAVGGQELVGSVAGSVPILITPAVLMLSGSLLARSTFSLTETDGAPPPSGSPLSELEPQALKASAATEAATTPSLIRTFIVCCSLPTQVLVSLG